METFTEHAERDSAVGVLPGLTAEQQREEEMGAAWRAETPQVNTLIRGTVAS